MRCASGAELHDGADDNQEQDGAAVPHHGRMLASRIIQKLAAFSTSSGRLLTSLLGNVVDDRGD